MKPLYKLVFSAIIFIFLACPITIFAQTEKVITSCRNPITESGYYILNSDLKLSNGAACISINDVQNVTLDCQGHSIINDREIGLSLSTYNSENIVIKSCKYVPNQNNDASFFIKNSRKVSISDIEFLTDNAKKKNHVTVEDSPEFELKRSILTGTTLRLVRVDKAIIQDNKLSVVDGQGGTEMINLHGGTDVRIINNEIIGSYKDTDDAIVLDSQDSLNSFTGVITHHPINNLLIQNNVMSNGWDCGVENVGLITNAKILGNKINNFIWCGIGGWYVNGWSDSTFANNIVDKSKDLFRFTVSYYSDPGVGGIIFKNNTFTNNRFTNQILSGDSAGTYPATSYINMELLQIGNGKIAPADRLDASNNKFSNNDFGKLGPAPVLLPKNAIIDGGGNVCTPSTDPNYPIKCNEILPSPSPSSSPSPSASPATYTVSYKLAEDPNALATASEIAYTQESVLADYIFKDTKPGVKTLFVEFKDNVGNTVTKSAQIELIPSPSGAPIIISACQEIKSPGNYVLNRSLGGADDARCDNTGINFDTHGLYIHDTHDVNIDCQGNTISIFAGDGQAKAITIKNVQDFTLKNCNIDPNMHRANEQLGGVALNIINATTSNSSITNNIEGLNIKGFKQINLTGSSNIKISGLTSKGAYSQENSNNTTLENSTFTIPDGLIPPGSIVVALRNGKNNKVIGNTIIGNAPTTNNIFTKQIGTDDGILLQGEDGDLIQGNHISNNWDAGIESVGYLYNTRIIGNDIKNSGYTGIGGWWDNSILGNTISDNLITDAYVAMFIFEFIDNRDELAGSLGRIYFKDNTFSNNKFISELNPNKVSAIFRMQNVPARFSDKLITGNNKFINNDFNINLLSPKLLPVSAIVDGGGNICKLSTDPDYPIKCNTPNSSPSPSSSPTAIPSPSVVPSASPSLSPTPSPSATPVAPPAGGGGGGSGGGGGGGGGSSSGGGGSAPAKKTIKYIKYAEDPYSLSSAPRVPYYPGDPLPYTFKNSPQGNKYFIFIRFEDENGQVFKINGQDYITQSIDVYSGETSTPGQPATPNTPPSTGNTEEVTIGTASLSTASTVSGSAGSWESVSINLSMSGFSSPGRSIVGLFVRNQIGECSINDCGYSGWTQIRSYGTNGTDSNSWTASGDLSAGVHMFAAFSLNADGTAGQLLAVSKTNFGSTTIPTNTYRCIGLTEDPINAASCNCSGEEAGKCDRRTTDNPQGIGGCNGGWCNGGKCQTCSP